MTETEHCSEGKARHASSAYCPPWGCAGRSLPDDNHAIRRVPGSGRASLNKPDRERCECSTRTAGRCFRHPRLRHFRPELVGKTSSCAVFTQDNKLQFATDGKVIGNPKKALSR